MLVTVVDDRGGRLLATAAFAACSLASVAHTVLWLCGCCTFLTLCGGGGGGGGGNTIATSNYREIIGDLPPEGDKDSRW